MIAALRGQALVAPDALTWATWIGLGLVIALSAVATMLWPRTK